MRNSVQRISSMSVGNRSILEGQKTGMSMPSAQLTYSLKQSSIFFESISCPSSVLDRAGGAPGSMAMELLDVRKLGRLTFEFLE